MQTLKGIFFPFVTWHTICVAASSLQELGTSFKAFIRLKSNAAITPSLLHKYPRSGMQNAPLSVARWQCYQSDTLPKSWLSISPMCDWQDGKSSIFFVKKEKKKHWSIKPLKSYRSTTGFAISTMATYLGCDFSLGIQLHKSPKKDRPWNTVQILKDS